MCDGRSASTRLTWQPQIHPFGSDIRGRWAVYLGPLPDCVPLGLWACVNLPVVIVACISEEEAYRPLVWHPLTCCWDILDYMPTTPTHPTISQILASPCAITALQVKWQSHILYWGVSCILLLIQTLPPTPPPPLHLSANHAFPDHAMMTLEINWQSHVLCQVIGCIRNKLAISRFMPSYRVH